MGKVTLNRTAINNMSTLPGFASSKAASKQSSKKRGRPSSAAIAAATASTSKRPRITKLTPSTAARRRSAETDVDAGPNGVATRSKTGALQAQIRVNCKICNYPPLSTTKEVCAVCNEPVCIACSRTCVDCNSNVCPPCGGIAVDTDEDPHCKNFCKPDSPAECDGSLFCTGGFSFSMGNDYDEDFE